MKKDNLKMLKIGVYILIPVFFAVAGYFLYKILSATEEKGFLYEIASVDEVKKRVLQQMTESLPEHLASFIPEEELDKIVNDEELTNNEKKSKLKAFPEEYDYLNYAERGFLEKNKDVPLCDAGNEELKKLVCEILDRWFKEYSVPKQTDHLTFLFRMKNVMPLQHDWEPDFICCYVMRAIAKGNADDLVVFLGAGLGVSPVMRLTGLQTMSDFQDLGTIRFPLRIFWTAMVSRKPQNFSVRKKGNMYPFSGIQNRSSQKIPWKNGSKTSEKSVTAENTKRFVKKRTPCLLLRNPCRRNLFISLRSVILMYITQTDL